MNHSGAYILAQHLIAEGELIDPAESGDWKVFVGSLPDGNEADDNAVGAIDTSPVKDGRLMGGAPLFHYGVQLLLRSREYNAGFAKADSVALAMSEIDDDSVSIDSNTYTLINVLQSTGVVALGQEDGTKRRYMFSVNFIATIRQEV